MRDRVVEICGRELDRMLEFEHESGRLIGYRDAIPIIGGEYRADRHADHVRSVGRALAAVDWHARTTPYSWAKRLPLRMEQCESLIDNDRNALRLLGYFGRSLRWNDWNIDRHPPFATFCSGALDYLFCPTELVVDQELLAMFPPRALAGIGVPLHWREPAHP